MGAMKKNDRLSADIGVWRSPVAHLLWEQGAGGSNPLTPTTRVRSITRNRAVGALVTGSRKGLPTMKIAALAVAAALLLALPGPGLAYNCPVQIKLAEE